MGNNHGRGRRAVVMATLAAISLCGGASAQTRVYLKPGEAVRRALPHAETVGRRVVRLTRREASALARSLEVPVNDTSYVFYEGAAGDSLTGRAVILEVLGQYQPITFVVALSPRGAVRRVEIMVYRESRGGEVRRRPFLRQFEGKSAADPIGVGRDVTAITGATVSSRSVARGVRLAVALCRRLGPPATLDRGPEDSP